MKNTVKSQKGKRGTQVGAPPKPVKFPRRKFTVEDAVSSNPNVCELTVRKRVAAQVKDGSLVCVGRAPQPKGAAGRPNNVFILKELAGSVKATKPAKTVKVKATKATKPASVPVVTVAPAAPAAPVTPTPASVTAPAAPVDATPAATVTPAKLP